MTEPESQSTADILASCRETDAVRCEPRTVQDVSKPDPTSFSDLVEHVMTRPQFYGAQTFGEALTFLAGDFNARHGNPYLDQSGPLADFNRWYNQKIGMKGNFANLSWTDSARILEDPADPSAAFARFLELFRQFESRN